MYSDNLKDLCNFTHMIHAGTQGSDILFYRACRFNPPFLEDFFVSDFGP